jgi:hypothetical protein
LTWKLYLTNITNIVLETPHVVVGAAIAFKVVNPALALPLALGSHFVLDKIPHWNPHTYTETKKFGKPAKNTTIIATVDSFLALGTGLFIAAQALPQVNHAIIILAACFLSVLPDISKAPYYYLKNRNGLLKKWVDIERAIQVETSNIALGMTTQLIIIIASLWWIFS